jgi:hypothetical protein
MGKEGIGKGCNQTVMIRGVQAETYNIPKRNDISALVPPPDHDRPAIEKNDISWARQIRIQRWLC